MADLLIGKLSEEASRIGWEHLETCETCIERAESIETSDQLVEAIINTETARWDSTDCDRGLQRAKRLGQQTRTFVAGNDTHRDAVNQPATGLADLLPPPEGEGEISRLGGFRLLAVLGQGGMGCVFLAEEVALGRQVALKVISPRMRLHDTAKQRFLREARSLAALHHDHVVPIFQVGESDGIPYFSMPMLQGESLGDRLRRDGTLAEVEATRIVAEAACGLAALHQQGILHRDIKPDNLWLEGSTGRTKVIDLGLADSSHEDELTAEGVLMGTRGYIAPEQVAGHAASEQSDLFSLGCVLYKSLTDALPYDGNPFRAALSKSHDCVTDRLTKLRPDLSRELVSLLSRMLSLQADERPTSADEVEVTLRQISKRATESSDASKQLLSTTSSANNRFTPWRWLAAAASFGFLIWLFAIVLRVETPEGMIVIEIDGSEQAIQLDVSQDNAIVFTDPSDGLPVTVNVDRDADSLAMSKAGF
ncbi:MAG: serine/threonine-protein kinase, partial [Planctomycetota bacterium]